MTFVQALILGVVEGLTEFLPISSTGHLIVVGEFLGLTPGDFLSSFYVAIQLGAILAVVWWYRGRWWRSRVLLGKVAVAFVPTAIIGLVFYSLIKQFLFQDLTTVIVALGVGGVALVIFERWYRRRATATQDLATLSYRQAALIGLAQSVAIVPGVSRAAATVVGGLMLGLSRPAIVEFSFLLALPTMAAATGLDLLKVSVAFTPEEWQALAVGFVVAFVVAGLVIKWLLRYVEHHTFENFGWYRLILALLLAGWWLV